jgi:protein-tyrosine-phosphatase
MMAGLPDAVLFACNRNSVRSVVAAALMRHRFGVDVASHHPKGFDELEDDSFDVVVSLTPEAQHRAVELTRGRATELEYWPIPDPTLETGSRDQRLAAYRAMRQDIAKRIAERFTDAPITAR